MIVIMLIVTSVTFSYLFNIISKPAQNFPKPMSDLKSTSSKQGTGKISWKDQKVDTSWPKLTKFAHLGLKFEEQNLQKIPHFPNLKILDRSGSFCNLFGSFWLVLAGFGSFWLVPGFSKYVKRGQFSRKFWFSGTCFPRKVSKIDMLFLAAI